jgi:hypothetical protein
MVSERRYCPGSSARADADHDAIVWRGVTQRALSGAREPFDFVGYSGLSLVVNEPISLYSP